MLLVATAIAVRERPSGAVAPIPGDPVTGFWPTLAAMAALLVAIVATTAGAVSLVRQPRASGGVPRVPGWERSQIRVKLTYLWLAVAALVIAIVVFPFSRRELDSPPTEVQAPATDSGAPPQTATDPVVTPDDGGSPVVATIILIIVAVFSIVVLVSTWRSLRSQRRSDLKSQVIAESGLSPEPLIRATELALQEVVDPDRPPREAIIACFVTMERALEDTEFAPRDSDTAQEVIERAVWNGLLPDAPAEALRELFTEARFSPHEMTAAQKDSAKTALSNAIEGLQR